jgi:hypothetical protein
MPKVLSCLRNACVLNVAIQSLAILKYVYTRTIYYNMKQYHIVKTVLKFIECIVETEQKSMPPENEIHYRLLSCLRSGTYC